MYINKPLLQGYSRERPVRPLTDFSRSQKKNELPIGNTYWTLLNRSK